MRPTLTRRLKRSESSGECGPASKRTMCRRTRLPYRGRLKWLGELSEDYSPLLHRGIGGGMYTRKFVEATGEKKVALLSGALAVDRRCQDDRIRAVQKILAFISESGSTTRPIKPEPPERIVDQELYDI